jgi:hypothetical protein
VLEQVDLLRELAGVGLRVVAIAVVDDHLSLTCSFVRFVVNMTRS